MFNIGSSAASFFARIRWPQWLDRRRYFCLPLGTRYRWYVAPARVSLIALCMMTGLGIVAAAIEMVDMQAQQRTMQDRLTQVQEQDRTLLAQAAREGYDLSASVEELPLEVGLANQMLVKRNFSWTQFLTGLEAAIPPRVSIKSVRLEPGSSMIHLTGAAVAVEDVTALALKLQNDPVFRDPVLGQHQAGGDGLVEFDLSLKYSRAGR